MSPIPPPPQHPKQVMEVPKNAVYGVGGVSAAGAIFVLIMQAQSFFYTRQEGIADRGRLERLETHIRESDERFDKKITILKEDMNKRIDMVEMDLKTEMKENRDLVLNRLEQITDRIINKINKQDSSLEDRVLLLERQKTN